MCFVANNNKINNNDDLQDITVYRVGGESESLSITVVTSDPGFALSDAGPAPYQHGPVTIVVLDDHRPLAILLGQGNWRIFDGRIDLCSEEKPT